jgi:DNA ligase D-like protein (predicted 3'-phosphoesterase)
MARVGGYVAHMGLSIHGNARQPRRRRAGKGGPCFVIQHHAVRSEYYDFRLEIDGVLVSWAIPRGSSVNPQDRRMARRTEDRPLEQAAVEETTFGDEDAAAGVIVWDEGTYANKTDHEMTTCVGRGHLSIRIVAARGASEVGNWMPAPIPPRNLCGHELHQA